ncbi:hypothetical protein B296_00012833, partial [Ensete ventricosum]
MIVFVLIAMPPSSTRSMLDLIVNRPASLYIFIGVDANGDGRRSIYDEDGDHLVDNPLGRSQPRPEARNDASEDSVLLIEVGGVTARSGSYHRE